MIRLLEKSSSASLLRPSSHPSGSPATKEIFIVHGHDELNTRRLGDIMRDSFGLTPIVIRDQAGAGRAILEKFERHADHCAFAFGLFTPDDSIRAAQGEYRQARPNVIFETGWFVGRLGSRRVCLLLQDGTDIHSDLHGISRIQFQTNVEEKVAEIQRELRAASLI